MNNTNVTYDTMRDAVRLAMNTAKPGVEFNQACKAQKVHRALGHAEMLVAANKLNGEGLVAKMVQVQETLVALL